MNEALQTPAPPQSPAQDLGLVDGEFVFQRNAHDGRPAYFETGWSIDSLQPYEENGETIQLAVVTKTDPETGQQMSRAARVNDLLSWQPTGEEQTSQDALAHAQALFSETSGVSSLMGNDELDAAIDALSPADRQAFESWQIEGAATRAPKLWEMVAQTPEDNFGYRRVSEEATPAFESALSPYGISKEAPTPEAIEAGIAQAQQLVESGQAANVLANQPFMSEKEYRQLVEGSQEERIVLKTAVYLDPALIRTTEGHSSWLGRGQNGSAGVNRRETDPATGKFYPDRPSVQQIFDYATRPSQLPEFEMGITLVLTKDGPVFASHNAHRTSAAKLRGEPVKFKFLTIRDVRYQ